MEHLSPEYLLAPHEVKCLTLFVEDKEVTFSTEDTCCWVYPEKYQMLNHLIKDVNGSYNAYFGFPQEVFDTLHEIGVTFVYPPYPTIEAVGKWWSIEMRDFDSELIEYDKTGEIPEGLPPDFTP